MSHLQRIYLSLALMAVSCLAAGCGSTSSDSPSEPERKLAAAYEELGRAFGERIVLRDYEGAYAHIAESSRAEIPYEEFLEAFKGYRESVGESPKFTVSAGEPYKKDEPDPLLPDSVRDRIEEEFAVHFEPEGDDEGFSAILWVLTDGGQAKIAHFFVGD